MSTPDAFVEKINKNWWKPEIWAHNHYAGFQGILALIHLGLGIFMTQQAVKSKCEGELPTFRLRFPFNDTGTVGPVFAEARGTIDLLGLDAFFVLFTFAAHVVYFINALLRYDDACFSSEKYGQLINTKYQSTSLSVRVRYFEYSVSASVMAVLIAASVGIVDDLLLFVLGGLIATTMLFGHIQDTIFFNSSGLSEDSKRVDFFNEHVFSLRRHRLAWLSFAMGCVPYAWYWIVIFWVYTENVIGEDVPVFVHTIVFSMFIMFTTFAVVQLVFQVIPAANQADLGLRLYYLRRADLWFHLLSFLSKFMLAFFVWGGLRRLKSPLCI